MRKSKNSSRLSIAAKMPPRYHTVPGQDFDIFKSEMIKWLVAQPEVLQYLFDKAKEYCEYDPISRKWRGKNVR